MYVSQFSIHRSTILTAANCLPKDGTLHRALGQWAVFVFIWEQQKIIIQISIYLNSVVTFVFLEGQVSLNGSFHLIINKLKTIP